MLSYIDPILFPDDILVIELTPGRYVYPIYKNGSSGLFEKSITILSPDAIRNLTHIEVFVRDPFERYISGVQTYLRYNSHLDRETTLILIEEFLFLNSHFTLQFHWLVNLQRFVDDIQMTFKSVSELDNDLGETWNTLIRDELLIKRFEDNDKLHFYLQLDKILYEDFMGKTTTFRAIMVHIHKFYPVLYEEVIERSQNLCAVLD
jgi:hypothetical protein